MSLQPQWKRARLFRVKNPPYLPRTRPGPPRTLPRTEKFTNDATPSYPPGRTASLPYEYLRPSFTNKFVFSNQLDRASYTIAVLNCPLVILQFFRSLVACSSKYKFNLFAYFSKQNRLYDLPRSVRLQPESHHPCQSPSLKSYCGLLGVEPSPYSRLVGV